MERFVSFAMDIRSAAASSVLHVISPVSLTTVIIEQAPGSVSSASVEYIGVKIVAEIRNDEIERRAMSENLIRFFILPSLMLFLIKKERRQP